MKKPYERALTLEELAQVPDEDIDLSDIPELGEGFFRNARVVRPEEWERRAMVRLDRDLVEWFKSQGEDYQARMSAVLRAFVNAHRS